MSYSVTVEYFIKQLNSQFENSLEQLKLNYNHQFFPYTSDCLCNPLERMNYIFCVIGYT